jgi:eukaryotic-like serine/threonine-protein kinase
MPLPPKLERLLRIMMLVFVLAAASFLSAVTAIRIAIRGRIVAMPDVVGKPVTEAQKLLAAKQLQISVADRVYSTLPVDSVVRQSPAPGDQMKVSQEGHVVLSLGAQTVTIPNLEGDSARVARITLLQSGLQLGEVSSAYWDSSDPDIVLKQDPPSGSSATSPRVDLLLAAGPRPMSYVMPALVGMDQQAADRILSAAGLRVAKRTLLAQAGAAKDTVVNQVPSGGEQIADDVSVELGIAQ